MYHEKRKSSVADPDCSHQRESPCSADGTESGSWEPLRWQEAAWGDPAF